ncbi:MAG: flagellar type III secretion system pore protein FliP [Leptospiraceae bacterium]|nr:flagellar type III secretion system pore protein FliP [Leptospiraceae bacterium]MDW7976489.1 flagellar type III secretion system pore protein FliP [Leptospiraceae bacterium]
MRKIKKILPFTFVVILFFVSELFAQEIPNLTIPVIEGVRAARNGQEASTSLMLILLVSILSLAPALIMMMTSYTKIVIVLDFVRRALALQNMPPNQVLFSLALFLTFFIMAPTFREFNERALEPYLRNELSTTEFLDRGIEPFRKFMIKQIGKDGGKEIALFVKLAGKDISQIQKLDDIDTYIVVPAFMLSEMKKAFIIGVLIFIPFIIIDIVISSTLMSMGMIMLPPAIISLPFKIILFILVDGWHLITYNLVQSYF